MSELAENVRAYLEEVRLAVFGTTNANGTPHITGLWFELRGDTLIFNTVTTSKKVRNLRRDPHAAACIIDHAAARHVTVEGTVTFDEDHVDADLVSLATRYIGPEAGPGVAQNIAKVPHITLKLSIDKVKTFGKI
jgi:PPOX class probable F420-dependent enzyme